MHASRTSEEAERGSGVPSPLAQAMTSPSWNDSFDDSRDDTSTLMGTAWVTALCSIAFDLDVGQQVEDCYPPDSLSPEEMRDIAFHSFPDSMSMELHSKSSIRDSTFFFRVRRRREPPDAEGEGAPGGEPRGDFLYGYVFCRQRQDNSLRRGGEQRAVVVVSELPYTSVLRPLCQIAGPLFFSYGLEALTQVYGDVCGWPAPEPGALLQLPVGGLNTISATLPPRCVLPPPVLAPEGLDSIASEALGLSPEHDEEGLYGGEAGGGLPTEDVLRTCTLGHSLFSDIDLHTPLKGQMSKIWTLWELALVGEPLLVVAPSPSETSAAVAAISTLASPLPYAGDFRPYYTIHDPQCAALVSGDLPDAVSDLPRLLGITNLYFLKVLYPKWQNILSVGYKPAATKGSGGGMAGPAGRVNAPPASPGLVGSMVRALRRRQQGPLQLMGEHCEMLWTAYRPLSSPDQALLGRLREAPPGSDSVRAARVAATNSAALRRHFEELTAALLAPFQPYITPELPPARGPLPKGGPRALPPFDPEQWLEAEMPAALGRAHPAVLDRFGSARALGEMYRRLVWGANLLPWLQRRQAAAVAWQARAWEVAREGRQVSAAFEDMDEVAMVQALSAMETKLSSAEQLHMGEGEVEAIKQEICALFEAMPMDLQQTLLLSPARAVLIQSIMVSAATSSGTVTPEAFPVG